MIGPGLAAGIIGAVVAWRNGGVVATIIADHQAFIRVRDNYPKGSRFIIELPVRRKTQRTQTSSALSRPILKGINGKGEEGEWYGRDHFGGG